jgi:tellurite resistance protein
MPTGRSARGAFARPLRPWAWLLDMWPQLEMVNSGRGRSFESGRSSENGGDMRKSHSGTKPPRGHEDDYFRRMDAELVEQRRRQAAAQQEHEEIKRAAGIDDDRLIAELRANGFNRETVPLLHLVPLIQVAWADGEISQEERRHILEAARLHGVEPDSPSHARLESWLDARPEDEFFRKSLRAIRAVLHALEPEHRDTRKADLLTLCTRVAAASGGFFGIGRKVSLEEKQLLAEIAAELDHNRHAAVVRVAEEMAG